MSRTSVKSRCASRLPTRMSGSASPASICAICLAMFGAANAALCRGPDAGNRAAPLRRFEEVDVLPFGEPGHFAGRLRTVRPSDGVVAAGERLDDVAACKAGRAGDEDGTRRIEAVHRRLSYCAW